MDRLIEAIRRGGDEAVIAAWHMRMQARRDQAGAVGRTLSAKGEELLDLGEKEAGARLSRVGEWVEDARIEWPEDALDREGRAAYDRKAAGQDAA